MPVSNTPVTSNLSMCGMGTPVTGSSAPFPADIIVTESTPGVTLSRSRRRFPSTTPRRFPSPVAKVKSPAVAVVRIRVTGLSPG